MSTPPPTVLGPGGLLCGRFRLERELGRGSVSTVFRAHDQLLGEVVAVKVIRRAEAPLELSGFRGEVALGRRVTHPNVVRVHDLHRDPVHGWFVSLEHLDGTTAREEASLRRFAADEVASVGAQVAAGLAALHAAQIVHRDVRVGNILLGRRVVLFDLGAAVPVGDATSRDGRGAGPEDDLFALGLALFELAAHAKPFPNRVNTLPPSRTERVPDLRPLQGLPWSLQAVIHELLDPTRPVRADDADTFSRRLARLPAGLRASTPPAPMRG